MSIGAGDAIGAEIPEWVTGVRGVASVAKWV